MLLHLKKKQQKKNPHHITETYLYHFDSLNLTLIL